MSDSGADSPAPDTHAETARASTRGVAVIAVAKLWFLLTGFAQPVLLTWILGQTAYGVYGTVLNAVSILNNVVVAGSIQAMSRAVTESGAAAVRRGLVLHLAVGATLASLLVALAGPFGAGLLGDPQVPSLLRVAAIVVANYSVYAALVGVLNGLHRFRGQAGLDILFATLRTTLVIALAATPLAVLGAVGGFSVASTVIVLVALVMVLRSVGRGEAHATAEAAQAPMSFAAFAWRYGRFFAPVLLYQLALNMVLQADLLVLKGVLIRRVGTTVDAVNSLVGVYKSVQNFAFLPYQLMLAVTFVAFPVVSRATLVGDREATRRFVAGTLRFSTLGVGAMLAVLAGIPHGVLRLAYPPSIAVGAAALRVLVIGQGLLALTVIGTTILVASGRIATATLVMVGTLSVSLAGNVAGVMLMPVGPHALVGAALGTTGAIFVGLVTVAAICRATFGAFVPAAVFVRSVVAACAAGAAIAFVPLHGKIGTLMLSLVGPVIYVALLVVLGEITPSDRAAFRRVLSRRAAR